MYHLLKAHAESTPAAVAIAAPGQPSLSYRQLLGCVETLAQTFNAFGVGPRDRVALLLPNGPEMAVCCLALMAGAACAPLNPAYRANELEFYFSDLKVKLVIVPAGTDSPAPAVARALGISCVRLSPLADQEAGLFTLEGEIAGTPAPSGFTQPDDAVLLLHTSGTTSRPKLVPLRQRDLWAVAQQIASSLELTGHDRCLNVMPLFHLHALSVLVASVAAGASVVCTPGFDAAQFFPWLEAFRPTWYSAAPTLHQAILEQAPAHRERIERCPLRFIRSTSAALPKRLIAELETVFQAPVIEAYAVTEAPSQITSNPLPPRPRKIGSSGLPTGPEVAIMDLEGRRLPPGEPGEVVIRGRHVLEAYENNPAADAQSFRDGWFRTGDQGYFDKDGYLFIQGRLKEIINRGGEKISPLEIEQALLDHPAIVQAAAFAVPHPRLGEDVAAAVVLRKEAAITEMEIRAHVAARLADFKVPRQVVIVPELPKGSTGKLQRLGLAERLGLATAAQAAARAPTESAAPRTLTEKKLLPIWSEVLRVKSLGIRDNFFELGGDSLSAAHLLVRIEKDLGRKLAMADLIEKATIEHLAQLLDEQPEAAQLAALVRLQPLGAQPPFFCVHGVGGEVLSYVEWARQMAPDYPFYAFQAVKDLGNGEPLDKLETMAAHYIREMRAVQPAGPYLLGGYSLGGLLAFEMARQLHAQGQPVALLAIVDQLSPLLRDRWPAWWRPSTLGEFLSNAPRWIYDDLFSAGPEGFLDRLRFKTRSAWYRLSHSVSGSGPGSPQAEVEKFFDVARIPGSFLKTLEIHYGALRSYTPRVYPGRVTLFRARTRPLFRMHGRDLGWSELVAGGVEIADVPGNHETVIREPHVGVVAKQLKVHIQKALASFESCKAAPR
jgi:acyl-CoA synthetase (AMP-forming)/AMP-acid ligase II/thioesterase domain-containing protein/acyl carrier protein